MKATEWLKYSLIRESGPKDNELNRILDKISNKEKLTDIESKFLKRYNSLSEDDMKDYHHLSNSSTFYKIQNILITNKIICNLPDRNGDMNMEITDTYFNYIEDKYYLILKDSTRFLLKDNLLFNIVYDMNKDRYSLQQQDEYFEEMPINREI